MESYHIRGGHKISGECCVKGAKNAALPILASTILSGAECQLSNIPEITDVCSMKKILDELGCKTDTSGETVIVDSRGLMTDTISLERMREMRSSVFLLGALLGRCGSAVISQPGGCNIGSRPIDLHLYALKKLGAEIFETEGVILCKASKLRGADIHFSFPSVGATENAIMAAATAEGHTVLHNCAMEPEITDLQDFLNACGAQISGAGTKTIHIWGRQALHGCSYRIIPDRIESGTYLAAAAATGGQITLQHAQAAHLESILQKLIETGCEIGVKEDKIYLKAPKRLKPLSRLVTGPYPAFPTDLQSPFLTMLTQAEGKSAVEETIFENRFAFTEELRKMGAQITVEGNRAAVEGIGGLQGCHIQATDLRGGASLVIAGLMAQGETILEGIEHIERGYADFSQTLRGLGADIRKTHGG
ncbi:UDP-N-acetylglucosamine 1-carboxyvinyltransferase [Aminipila butyrica]|uniref:UDP-N-acetylglucosamine 1-carboxyvinyltransferase n=1 Tax=Aminipila butyrica TaxID=433296 RepID=A0A858BVX2_9FIRM|nr:UDP-N-acetylglucosamine 1-carboxyvinyltransferase [Aminipila butyrica]QIB70093.1 UDP-N-acetylglucosamine 1-carboxyvinyltransferase [Aminipila butyrica]